MIAWKSVVASALGGIGGVATLVIGWWLTEGPLGPSASKSISTDNLPVETRLSEPKVEAASEKITGRYSGHAVSTLRTPTGQMQTSNEMYLDILEMTDPNHFEGRVRLIFTGREKASPLKVSGTLYDNLVDFEATDKDGRYWFEGKVSGSNIVGVHGVNWNQHVITEMEALKNSSGVEFDFSGDFQLSK